LINTIDTRRITYTLMTRSQAWLSEASGVPRSTLSYVARGLRELPAQYRESIRNVYQGEAYGNLRMSGASSTQANRFKWYVPETVLNVQSSYGLKAMEWTVGVIGSKLKGLGRPATEQEVLNLWDESYEDVIDGMQQSKEPYERVMEDIT
jgi:hypothetical protein